MSSSTAEPDTTVREPATGRSPCDVLRLVVGAIALLALLLVQALFGDTLVTFASELLAGLSAFPDWLLEVVVGVVRLAAVVLLLVGLVAAILRGRWHFLLVTGAAGLLGAALAALLAPTDPGTADGALESIVAPGFPTGPGLAAVAAVLTAAAPWLSRRDRRVGWLVVVGLVLTRFLAAPLGHDSFRAWVIGWVAGSAALVIFGGPIRRPSAAAVMASLASYGLPLQTLERAGVDARGSTPYFGADAQGGRYFVKVLGADERSADLLFRLYRRATRRQFGDERAFSSLRRAVEHEALVALAARDLGVRTPRFVLLARAEPNAFVLVYEAIAGRSLDRVPAEELTDELLGEVWQQLAILRRHGVAHRDLRLANLFRDDHGAVWLIDFGFSELAASELLLATDVAELVASTATRVGPTRAAALASRYLPPELLREAEARLQPWALSGATRTACKDDPELLPAVRAALSSAAAPVG
jgi:glycosyltransferase 2 family protein